MLYEAITRIQMLIEHDKLNAAREKLAEAMSLYPETGILYALDSQIHARQDKLKEALVSIEKAIGYDPENAFFYYYKSSYLLRNKEQKKALELIDVALGMAPGEAQFYGQKALILFNTEKREEAIEYSRKGLAVDPGNMLCSNVLSMALSSTGQSDQAHDVLEFALEEEPENALSHTNMGYNYLRQNDIAKAKEHFGIALSKDPDFEYARAGMIQCIKATNFFYRKLLQYSVWMEKIGRANQWFFIIGLIVLVQVLPVLAPIYLIFVFWVWFADPLSNAVLYFDNYGRYLMSGNERKLTVLTLFLLGSSLVSLVVGLTMNPIFLALAFGLFVAVVPVYRLDSKETKLGVAAMVLFAAAFILMGFAAVITPFVPALPSFNVWSALIITTVAYTWIANLVR